MTTKTTLIPDFISQEDFRSFQSASGMKKIFGINNKPPTSLINKEAECGRPFKFFRDLGGVKRFKVSHIIARAKAKAMRITHPDTELFRGQRLKDEIARLEKRQTYLISETLKLESELKLLKLQEQFPDPLKLRLLPVKDIVAGAHNQLPRSGIYFLIYGDEIVYVGQSKSILSRIGIHIANPNKLFTGFSYFECAEVDLDTYESIYIHILQPKYNGINVANDRAKAPISMRELEARLSFDTREVLS